MLCSRCVCFVCLFVCLVCYVVCCCVFDLFVFEVCDGGVCLPFVSYVVFVDVLFVMLFAFVCFCLCLRSVIEVYVCAV